MPLEGNGLLQVNTTGVEAYEGLVHNSPVAHYGPRVF